MCVSLSLVYVFDCYYGFRFVLVVVVVVLLLPLDKVLLLLLSPPATMVGFKKDATAGPDTNNSPSLRVFSMSSSSWLMWT